MACALVAVVALTAASGVATRAEAQKPAGAKGPEAPDTRKQGDEAMRELRYGDALAAYRAAYEQSHDPVLFYNMARACQSLERFPESIAYAERFKAEAPAAVRAKVPGLDRLIEQLKARVSTLSLAAEPAGARVLLRGVEIARTPLPGPLKVNAGAGKLEVLLDGFVPFEQALQLDPGATVEVKVKLVAREKPVEKPAILSVRAHPDGAQVSLDGAPLGVAPLETPVGPGPHRLDLSKPGYQPLSTPVQLDRGARQELDLTLVKDSPSVLSSWWFWTGVGVVAVAGGVALTYALTTDRDAKQGSSFSPGQVHSSLVRF